MLRFWRVAAVMIGGCLLGACSESSPPSAGNSQGAAPAPAAAQSQPAPEATGAKAAPPTNVGDLFPAGQGREHVLETCGSCHSVACTAQGQRTSDQWDRIKDSHSDKLASLSSADLDALFTYLKANFNDAKPEPDIPAEFLQQGCTPF